jgi:hypothetical protein
MANGEWRMANGEWRMANGDNTIVDADGIRPKLRDRENC